MGTTGKKRKAKSTAKKVLSKAASKKKQKTEERQKAAEARAEKIAAKTAAADAKTANAKEAELNEAKEREMKERKRKRRVDDVRVAARLKRDRVDETKFLITTFYANRCVRRAVADAKVVLAQNERGRTVREVVQGRSNALFVRKRQPPSPPFGRLLHPMPRLDADDVECREGHANGLVQLAIARLSFVTPRFHLLPHLTWLVRLDPARAPAAAA